MPKRFDILALRPTQMALGMLEVKERADDFSGADRGQLRKLVKKCRISIVIAPNGSHYIVDGHHHACVFWLLGVKKVALNVLKDFSRSKLNYRAFWREMRRRRWTHLYDQCGQGPHDPVYLPEDIRGLGDDPYRSLAWLVEREGGFEKSERPFAPFQWANFFRERKLLHCKYDRDIPAVKGQALKLARSPAARRLPGFLEAKAKAATRR